MRSFKLSSGFISFEGYNISEDYEMLRIFE